MRMKNVDNTWKVAGICGIIISWLLLIVGFCALRGIGGMAVNAIANGLLIGNVCISSIIYVRVIRDRRE